MKLMTITQAASQAGITPKMARHYESLGLITPAHRSESGYRLYAEEDVRILRIIGRARDLGFPLHSIARLLEAAQDGAPADIDAEIHARIQELERQHLHQSRLLEVLRSLAPAQMQSLAPLDRTVCPAAQQEADTDSPRPRIRGRHHRSTGESAPVTRNPLFTAWGSTLPRPH